MRRYLFRHLRQSSMENEESDAGSVQLIDPETKKINKYAGITCKDSAVDALNDQLEQLNGVAVKGCSKLCYCFYKPPSDADFKFKEQTITVRVICYKGRKDEKTYDVSWPALVASVTVDGECSSLSGAHWLYPRKKKTPPLYE